MPKIKVTVIDPYTLKLENDAKIGDTIDLREVTSVDTSVLINLIESKKDELYTKMLKEEINKYDLLKQHELDKEVLKYSNQIDQLETKIKTINESINKDLNNAILKKDNEYQVKIKELESNIENLKQKHEFTIMQNANKSANEINDLKSELKNKDNEFEVVKTKQFYEIKEKYDVEKNKLEEQIANLKRDKTSNVKRIGENLESWCDNEFMQQHSLMPQKNVVWQKDNEVVGGTKGDFIYKVYATDELIDSQLLTSALLEMKSEDPESKTKTTNKSHFKKLDSDRTKKNLEYAILVSELEWNNDSTNDLPIRKVDEYEKMYIVRPQYFMTLLNIIGSFGLKYKEILLAKEQERIKFKDIDDILIDFENMKDEILNNSINHINTQLTTIIKQSNVISDANEKLQKAATLILERHLETVKNKINDFKINRITNNINDVK